MVILPSHDPTAKVESYFSKSLSWEFSIGAQTTYLVSHLHFSTMGTMNVSIGTTP